MTICKTCGLRPTPEDWLYFCEVCEDIEIEREIARMEDEELNGPPSVNSLERDAEACG